MIKFFRKIRQQLLSENKFTKYILYAFGEILLVVIGILLALQINAWNTERLDREQEIVYLKKLLIDLNRDLEGVQGTIDSHERHLLNGKILVDVLGKNNSSHLITDEIYLNAQKSLELHPEWIANSFGGKFFEVLKIHLFNQTDVTFQELIASGKIDIIQNQELKTAIQEHYPNVQEFQNFQDRIIYTVQNNFREALIKNNISNYNTESYEQLVIKITDKQGLIVALENYMGLSRAALDGILYSDYSVKNNTDFLIQKIETELNSRITD